jgi:hypothetical protein
MMFIQLAIFMKIQNGVSLMVLYLFMVNTMRIKSKTYIAKLKVSSFLADKL